MNQELLGALCLVQNFRKLTEIQSSEVFRFPRELSGEGVQVLYSVALQILWSTSTSQCWSISTLTMMYSVVLVHLSTGSVALVLVPPWRNSLSCQTRFLDT
jgi:hypothetical protein